MKSGVTDFTEYVLLCGAPAGLSRFPDIVGVYNTSIFFLFSYEKICCFMEYLYVYGINAGLLNNRRK